MAFKTIIVQSLIWFALFVPTTKAQGGWHRGGGDVYSGRPPWWYGPNSDDSTSLALRSSFTFARSSSGQQALIAHAVTASAVWALLMPIGGILLRMNIRSPWVLRVHAGLQIFSYIVYIAACGLGIYLVQNMSGGPLRLWEDAHPGIGLAILVLALFQPILGGIHHRKFKERVEKTASGKGGPAPGRTIFAHIHLWLGRFLIVLGIVNGGLGLVLAGRTPFQTPNTIFIATVTYGTVAGLVGLIYAVVVILFEVKKSRRERKFTQANSSVPVLEEMPPTYIESQQTQGSLHKGVVGVTRYG